MKPVDHVDKSGLPVAIGGVELTEKDLQCITRRLQELWRVQFMGESKDVIYSNCETCNYANDCGRAYIGNVFKKLSKITNVPITLFSGPKGMCIPGNFVQEL